MRDFVFLVLLFVCSCLGIADGGTAERCLIQDMECIERGRGSEPFDLVVIHPGHKMGHSQWKEILADEKVVMALQEENVIAVVFRTKSHSHHEAEAAEDEDVETLPDIIGLARRCKSSPKLKRCTVLAIVGWQISEFQLTRYGLAHNLTMGVVIPIRDPRDAVVSSFTYHIDNCAERFGFLFSRQPNSDPSLGLLSHVELPDPGRNETDATLLARHLAADWRVLYDQGFNREKLLGNVEEANGMFCEKAVRQLSSYGSDGGDAAVTILREISEEWRAILLSAQNTKGNMWKLCELTRELSTIEMQWYLIAYYNWAIVMGGWFRLLCLPLSPSQSQSSSPPGLQPNWAHVLSLNSTPTFGPLNAPRDPRIFFYSRHCDILADTYANPFDYHLGCAPQQPYRVFLRYEDFWTDPKRIAMALLDFVTAHKRQPLTFSKFPETVESHEMASRAAFLGHVHKHKGYPRQYKENEVFEDERMKQLMESLGMNRVMKEFEYL